MTMSKKDVTLYMTGGEDMDIMKREDFIFIILSNCLSVMTILKNMI